MPTLRALLPRTIGTGLVAGLIVVYLSMVGLVGAFERRDAIADVITVGRLMLAALPFAATLYIGPRLRRAHATPIELLAGGLLVGLVAGGVLWAFLLITSVVNIGGIFIQVRQPLQDFLTFEQGPIVGGAINVAAGAVVGLAGGALQLLGPVDRRAALNGLIAAVAVSLMHPLLNPILNRLELSAIQDFVFQGSGLSLAGATVIGGGFALLSWGWSRPAAPYRQRFQQLPAAQRRPVSIGLIVAAFVLVLIIPQISGSFVSLVLVQVGFALLLALGLNIVVGYAGLLDLGYVAFYAVGAYTVAVLLAPSSSLNGVFTDAFGPWAFWAALPVVMIVAAIVGLFIGAPVLRLRGDYLAIVTLGFGEIARILFLSDAMEPWVGGAQGIVGIPNLELPLVGIEFTRPEQFFYPLLAFCGLAAYIAWRLADSRTGRAWNAMREDEQVAEATGVSTMNYKLLAFALGATLGCLGGALFAVQLGSVFPNTFNILVSITTLAIIILGGMGSIPGVVVGALLLIGLPELLREFEQYRLLIYGGVLVAMMITRPEGLFPNRVRRAELHEAVEPEEREQLEESDGELSVGTGPVATRGPGGQP